MAEMVKDSGKVPNKMPSDLSCIYRVVAFLVSSTYTFSLYPIFLPKIILFRH